MTITGRLPLLLLLGIGLVVVRPSGDTVLLYLVVVALMVALDTVLAAPPGDVTVSREASARGRVGDHLTSTLFLHNTTRRRLRLLVRDAWQPSAGAHDNRHRLRLGPDDRTRVTTPLTPRRRGLLRAAGVTVRSYGPFGLAARQRTLEVAGEVRVVHPFEARKHLPSRLARLRDLDGRAAVRVRGQGTEFDSLREYVRGDDVRSIDWRASARNRNVVVRTWQPERDRRVVLVLDTSRTSAGRVDDVPRLDSAMDAAMLLAALAARAGDRVDFVAGDRLVHTRLRLGSARDVAARLQDALANVEPVIAEADWSALVGAVGGLGRQRALVVLLTPLESSALEEGLLPVLPALIRHHRVVIASVRDPELDRMVARRDDIDTVYGAAAAEQVAARRRFTREVVQTLGVDVVDADAESLPPELADHYLMLKARGLL